MHRKSELQDASYNRNYRVHRTIDDFLQSRKYGMAYRESNKLSATESRALRKMWSYEAQNKRKLEEMVQWAAGQVYSRTSWQPDKFTVGQIDSWTSWQPDKFRVGQVDSRTNLQLDKLTAGQVDSRTSWQPDIHHYGDQCGWDWWVGSLECRGEVGAEQGVLVGGPEAKRRPQWRA